MLYFENLLIILVTIVYFNLKKTKQILELGGMTKNVYHGIFLNYTGFTVYDGIIFFHAWPGVNHIFYWLRKNCSRLT